MKKQDIADAATRFIQNASDNYISAEVALTEDMIGLQIFQNPLVACGDAEDALFMQLLRPEIMGPHFLLPTQWLPQAKTVISYFLPFTAPIRKANGQNMAWPTNEWLHGRIEGQKLLNRLSRFLEKTIMESGYQAVAPSLDKRLLVKYDVRSRFSMKTPLPPEFPMYQSNWSERHAAYICGLGTFGLSRGLITVQGTAGRFGSIITTLSLEPDKRSYTSVDEYCIRCGKCAKNCPIQAISIDTGKDHQICSDFLQSVEDSCYPYYGCGKCQVKVPCENRIPRRPKSKTEAAI